MEKSRAFRQQLEGAWKQLELACEKATYVALSSTEAVVQCKEELERFQKNYDLSKQRPSAAKRLVTVPYMALAMGTTRVEDLNLSNTPL